MEGNEETIAEDDAISSATPYTKQILMMETTRGYDPDCGIPKPGRPLLEVNEGRDGKN